MVAVLQDSTLYDEDSPLISGTLLLAVQILQRVNGILTSISHGGVL